MTRKITNLIVGQQSGQAIVELAVVIFVCLAMAFGIFEIGVYIHNISVLNRAADSASLYASYGAPIENIEEVFVSESSNLLYSAFIYQELDTAQLFVDIYNPYTGDKIAPLETTDFPFDQPRLEPARELIAPYLFWAQGYEIEIGLNYLVGFQIPFLRALTASRPIVSRRVIQTANDLDRDGLVDSWEAGYLLWFLDQTGDTEWVHPSHLDYTGEVDSVIQPDYDHSGSGIENKFDPGNNLLYQNPAIGP